MATTPFFFLSPITVLSLIGLAHGPDKTLPNPAEDWRDATVDVVIPAFNEESNIPLCLAALARGPGPAGPAAAGAGARAGARARAAGRRPGSAGRAGAGPTARAGATAT